MTALDLITDAAKEVGIVGQGETLSGNDAADLLGQLNRLIDSWNAEREAIYASQLLGPFTITASLNPHTIGASGQTWTATQRPVSIEGAQLRISSTNTYPLNIRDAEWYQRLASPALTSALPTDIYYQPDWANGKVYFYPVPTTAYTVQLLVRQLLSEYVLATTLSLPPGYRDALTLTVAENAAEMFGRPVSPRLALRATRARARIFVNNLVVPKLCTQDAGMSSGEPAWFDYETGGFTQ